MINAILAYLGTFFTKYFLDKFWKLLEKAAQAAIDYYQFKEAEKKVRKKVKAQIKEIKNDKDRLSRAKRMRDYLNN